LESRIICNGARHASYVHRVNTGFYYPLESHPSIGESFIRTTLGSLDPLIDPAAVIQVRVDSHWPQTAKDQVLDYLGLIFLYLGAHNRFAVLYPYLLQ